MRRDIPRYGVRTHWSGRCDYDLVIVGAGISGLSTGILWLMHAGGRVLIVEKNNYAGGYVTAWRRGEHVFETTQLIPDVAPLLDHMQLDLPLHAFEDTYMRRLVVRDGQVDEYRLPMGVDDVTRWLAGTFPAEESGIRALMRYIRKLYGDVGRLEADPGLVGKLVVPIVAPRVVACLDRTWADLLGKFGIRDPRLREVLESFSDFSALPPSRASAIITAGSFLASVGASYRPRVTFDALPAQMVRRFLDLGGELRLRAPVSRIVVESGRVRGVDVAEESETIRAGAVVTTIDPVVAMRQLVGDRHLPASWTERLERTLMSPSSFDVHLGLDDGLDPGGFGLEAPYNVVSTGLGTWEKLHDAFLEGRSGFSEDVWTMGVSCPSLVTGGRPRLHLTAMPLPAQPWMQWRRTDRATYREEKMRFARVLVERAEMYLVGDLARHVEVMDVSTPATYGRYSGSPTGSIYDMAATPRQFGPRRLPTRTPVRGLYQPKFAQGILGGLMNGVQVVDLLTGGAVNRGRVLFDPR